MFYIIYASDATKTFTRSELLELLTKSRENNTKLGITGMLIYKAGSFMQVLEGEELVVQELYKKIQQDSRHTGIMVLDEGNQANREFNEWSMGFKNLEEEEVKSVEGYNQFMNTPLTSQAYKDAPSLCWVLLTMFKGYN